MLERCALLRVALDDYTEVEAERAGVDPREIPVRINLRHANLLELVVNQANQLRKATERPGVPKAVRLEGLGRDLAERILRLRDMREHWEANQTDFSSAGAGQPRKAVRAYTSRFPAANPWSSARSNTRGLDIGGVLNGDELGAAARRIEDLVRSEPGCPTWAVKPID